MSPEKDLIPIILPKTFFLKPMPQLMKNRCLTKEIKLLLSSVNKKNNIEKN
jgi:hypothetical protein